ncbi:MAG: TolC family protein [Calditrichaeota bacterium]|nr:MAG: TolC family protein [Calditrichota bacterium]MBL1208011.1 TolC family protein [Calditrichota bacterium]NOG47847.1 TolC family protein [Calditrichota bacterium]
MRNILIILMMLLFQNLSAQQTINLTFEKAKELAISQSLIVKMATKEAEFAESQVDEAYSTLYPQIEGILNYTRNFKNPLIISSAFPQPIEMGKRHSMVAGISVNQAIWIGGKLFTARDIAELAFDDAQNGIKVSKENLINDVTKTFYSALLMKEILNVTEEMLLSAKENFKNIKALKKEGMASEFDSLRVSVFVANLETEVIQSTGNYKTVVNALKFLLEMELKQKVEIIGQLVFIPVEHVENVNEVLNNNRTELQRLKTKKEILVKLKSIERANHFPSVFAMGNLQRVANSDDFIPKDKSQFTVLNAGIGISIPLFNGFQTSVKVQQAQIQIDIIEQGIQLFLSKSKMEIENSSLKLEEALKRIASQKQSVSMAEKAVEIAKVRFKNGLSTQVELNDAETALKRVKLARLAAIYDYMIAKTEYKKLLGIVN